MRLFAPHFRGFKVFFKPEKNFQFLKKFTVVLPLNKINDLFTFSSIKIFLWSDSTIVLNWISSPSRKWTVFVAKKINEIQHLTNINSWRHISTTDSECFISGSLFTGACQLVNMMEWSNLLNNARDYLTEQQIYYFKRRYSRINTTVSIAIGKNSIVEDFLDKHFSLNKICRILAHCLKFFKTKRINFSTNFISHSKVSLC